MNTMTRVCERCKKEKELNKRNYVAINYGNECRYTNTCRDCIRYERLSLAISNMSNKTY